jgi:hypothetical protein
MAFPSWESVMVVFAAAGSPSEKKPSPLVFRKAVPLRERALEVGNENDNKNNNIVMQKRCLLD